MDFLSTIIMINLVGIGANLDNSSIGMAYGIEKVHFPHRVNFIVNVIGFISALIGTYAGKSLSQITPYQFGAISSCIVLSSLGCFILYSNYIHPYTTQKKELKLQRPNLRMGIYLGLGLSISNAFSGLGVGLADTANMWWIALSITVWGYLLIWFGNLFGAKIIVRRLGKHSSFVAGLLLIIIGIKQIY
ncbi:sporulation protein [Siminovitchia terrae]|uniref:manganese efflux pump MntP n=1 Tax=Siminovitchia terrae TaxID=1914933 RepID=UPI001B0D5438|nr:manganese efflux pump [Siminovitchia terrae]GIN91319.1 sporulation protein [Siminovitchia terrae]